MNERSERMSTKTTQMAEIRYSFGSFYSMQEEGNVSNEPVHKEEFCVPVSGTQNFSKVIIET